MAGTTTILHYSLYSADHHEVNTSFQSGVEGWYYYNTKPPPLFSRPPPHKHLLFPVLGWMLIPSQYYNSSTQQNTTMSAHTFSSLVSKVGTITRQHRPFHSAHHHWINTCSFQCGVEGWYHHNITQPPLLSRPVSRQHLFSVWYRRLVWSQYCNSSTQQTITESTPTLSGLGSRAGTITTITILQPPPTLHSPHPSCPPPPPPPPPPPLPHSRQPLSQHLLFPVCSRRLVPSQYYNSSTQQTTIKSTPTLSSLGSRAGTITILQQFYWADHHHVNTYSFQSGVEGWYHHNTTAVLLSRPPSRQHLLFPVWGRGLGSAIKERGDCFIFCRSIVTARSCASLL